MLEHCTIVLCRAMFGGNVGASARAVKNTGLGGLRLFAPLYEDEKEATMFSHGAEEILTGAPRHPQLADAIAGCERVVGFTARRRTRRRIGPLRAFAEGWVEDALRDGPASTALLFGNERDGLTTTEMDHCTEMVWIPAVPDHPSYNLSQAVLLAGYELLTARLASDERCLASNLARPGPRVRIILPRPKNRTNSSRTCGRRSCRSATPIPTRWIP